MLAGEVLGWHNPAAHRPLSPGNSFASTTKYNHITSNEIFHKNQLAL